MGDKDHRSSFDFTQDKSIIDHRNKRQAGFTLLEILVVMAILGIMAGMIGMVSISSRLRARDARRKSNMDQIANALEMYLNDYGVYPVATANGEISGCGVDGAQACVWGSEFSDDNGTVYMGKIPGDPTSTYNYYYWSSADGKEFQLYSLLENLDDREINTDVSENPLYFSGTDCVVSGPGRCNYGVSSTNISTEEGRTLDP